VPDLFRVSVERVVPAPPQQVFDLLADPRRHPEIDGSGSVRRAVDGPERLHRGARFGMRMQMGGRYSMTSTVTDFDEGRRIAWQPRPTQGGLAMVIGGRTWRYELTPVEGGTLVRETWDAGTERFPLPLLAYRVRVRRDMEQTLVRLEQALATPSR
jgi:uncharacterized protein YndB with AHSA1/START domain